MQCKIYICVCVCVWFVPIVLWPVWLLQQPCSGILTFSCIPFRDFPSAVVLPPTCISFTCQGVDRNKFAGLAQSPQVFPDSSPYWFLLACSLIVIYFPRLPIAPLHREVEFCSVCDWIRWSRQTAPGQTRSPGSVRAENLLQPKTRDGARLLCLCWDAKRFFTRREIEVNDHEEDTRKS